MEFRLLGPLEVADEAGHPIPLGPPRQRALLAALLLDAGTTVSIDRLVDMLWEEHPPATAATMVHGAIAGIRKALEPGKQRRVVVTESGGYKLDVAPEQIDAVRFERAVERARSELDHDAERAWRTLSDALELWRGRALADVDDGFAIAASGRLEDLRIDAVEVRAEAGLATGRHVEAVRDLEAVVADHPLRERSWAILLAALHRAGRSAEALHRYEVVRHTLDTELGAEPSVQLRAVHEAILRNESATVIDVPDHPTGVTTFLLTDIERSSALWETDEEGMRRSHARHQEIVRKCARTHRGVLPIEQGEGDSAVIVFGRATDAIACASDIQRSIASEAWPEGTEIKVRIGLHTGEAELRDGTYYGVAINRCARVRELAHGGQVLLSGATADVAADQLPEGVSLVDLGTHRLRDLTRAERIWQLAADGLERRFPPLRGVRPRHNLPAVLSSLIGRRRERDEIGDLLERRRIVTLVGPGGSGKTRLALDVAGELSGAFGGGVWFVDLAQLTTPDLVVEAVANAVGVRGEAGRPLTETVGSALADRESLLVLDNCEHVLDPCAELVVSVVSSGDGARVLTTSREALNISGETLYPVGPLSLAGSDEPWERVAASESVRLFTERAAAARPGFVVDESNASTVGELCRRLDGVPLAIELAAARVATMPLSRIVERLDDRFRLLDAGTRSASPRHRSLEAAVQWSYDLLEDDERSAFERLSVFAGSFVLESAEAVVGLETTDVATTLSKLVARSLVQFGGRDERYRMLETLREYGAVRLADAGLTAAVRERHARHYLDVVRDAWPRMRAAGSPAWYDRIEADEPNIRAALEWAFGADGDAAVGVGIACSMWFYWDVRGADGESAHWLDASMATAAEEPSVEHAILLAAAAQLSMRKGEYDDGERMADRAAQLRADLHAAGSVEAWEIAAVYPRGIAPWARGDFERAKTVLLEELEESYAGGQLWYAVQVQYLLARVLRDAGELDRADAETERALEHARELGEDQVLGLCSDLAASLARRRGDLDEARTLVDDALRHYRATGYQEGEASVLSEAGRLALDVGDAGAAAHAFAQALELCRQMGHRAGLAAAIEGQARVLGMLGDASGAAALFGAAAALRRDIGAPLPAAERAEQDRELLGLAERIERSTVDEALARGAAMSLDDIVDVAAGARLAGV
jgi:predicted ATPase/DNA-binding SARP family transcriptional activator